MTNSLPCESCDESGEVYIGHDRGSYWSPPEPIYAQCPICNGTGAVLEEDLREEWDGTFPDEDDCILLLLEESEYDQDI